MDEIGQSIFKSIKPDSFEDRAYACIIGSFIGDSCGSFLEFEREIIDDQRMEECMKMNGGGPFLLAAGQVTDDSELAMCLMHGLIDQTVPKGLQK